MSEKLGDARESERVDAESGVGARGVEGGD